MADRWVIVKVKALLRSVVAYRCVDSNKDGPDKHNNCHNIVRDFCRYWEKNALQIPSLEYDQQTLRQIILFHAVLIYTISTDVTLIVANFCFVNSIPCVFAFVC